jgi:hypothetical protein
VGMSAPTRLGKKKDLPHATHPNALPPGRAGTPSYGEGMVPATRWLTVAAVAIVLVALPLVTQALPARQFELSATALAERIRGSDQGWSGEVRSLGSLQVPLGGSTFGGVARLLGEQTHLRVWWRGPTSWRVDRLRTTGETDSVRDGDLTAGWNYERNEVRFTPYSPVRLPDDVDVVPLSLARRLLAGARPSELTRLPARRVAGRSAPGLRLVPSDGRTTIERVDLWADEATGLPLRVEVYAAPAGRIPVLSTEVVTLRLDRPTLKQTRFEFSRGIRYSRGQALDAAAGANAFAPFQLPSVIADLPRRGRAEDLGAVGVYGRGPTAVLAIPLRDSIARGLRDQLRRSTTSREAGDSIAMEVGPLSVLLERRRSGNFLLMGTVTPATLETASEDLVAGVVRTR